jgi:glutathione synthase/RimK-type ligase-like ATP-grasp enzyme
MKIRLLCTDIISESAERLAKELSERVGYKVIRTNKVVPNRKHIRYGDQRDKLTQYKFFRKNQLNFPLFTESKEEATDWMKDLKLKIVCRTLLQGQEGHGIIIADTPEQVVDAKVYVEYREKNREYRVNIFDGEVVNVREKLKKIGYVAPEHADPRIRNIVGGYIYCIPKRIVPICVIETAIKASKITDSDIIGVDVAYDSKTEREFILEVNSAPSLEGVTVTNFADIIIDKYGEF